MLGLRKQIELYHNYITSFAPLQVKFLTRITPFWLHYKYLKKYFTQLSQPTECTFTLSSYNTCLEAEISSC